MSNRTEHANDMIQTARTREDCLALLRDMSLSLLRAVADLNHLETHGRHETLIKRIADDRFPPR
jgi:hypothetical protein